MCGSDGYPYQASMYCGKSDSPKNLNLSEYVVLFAAMLPEKSRHQLFLTTFLSHTALSVERSGHSCNWNCSRGSAGNGTSARQYLESMKVCFVRWNDTNVVKCGSNYDTFLPEVKVARPVKGSKDK